MEQLKTVLVTGSNGFVGRNLCFALLQEPGLEVLTFGSQDDAQVLASHLDRADVVYHLAGVNRPKSDDEFEEGNAGLTRFLCQTLQTLNRSPKIVFTSSIQADLDNPYGATTLQSSKSFP